MLSGDEQVAAHRIQLEKAQFVVDVENFVWWELIPSDVDGFIARTERKVARVGTKNMLREVPLWALPQPQAWPSGREISGPLRLQHLGSQ